ncbi:hypothetical protein D3C71_1805850 [compost metagenome]
MLVGPINRLGVADRRPLLGVEASLEGLVVGRDQFTERVEDVDRLLDSDATDPVDRIEHDEARGGAQGRIGERCIEHVVHP